MPAEELFTEAWDRSYGRNENFLFVPGDEVVRFVARYLRRRVDIDAFVDIASGAGGSRVLDVGCGIGRNLLFGATMGFEMYGSDLSVTAVAKAAEWLSAERHPEMAARIRACDIRQLPWERAFFDHAMSDSVLDSMSFEVAQAGVAEVARVLKPGGYFYCSLISGDETGREPDFCDEVQVGGSHEHGTIQSYFNLAKIRQLLDPQFDILDCSLTQVRNPLRKIHSGRWHVTCQCR